jgi:ribosomal protein L11 methyltransferase
VVVANILAGVILELLDDLAAVMAPGGLFICSGILDTQAPSIIEKMAEKGFRLADRMTEEAWSALAGEYTGD